MNMMREGFFPQKESKEGAGYEALRSPDVPRASQEFLEFLKNESRIPDDVRQVLEVYGQRFEHIENLALTDELTGLPNRREFSQRLEWLQDLNVRYNGGAHEYSVVAFDLDGFKVVNDTFGHEAGDRCLKLVAEEVARVIRQSDLFAREGGDEFVILLPETDEQGATETIEKVFKAIDERVSERLRKEYPTSAGVSASIGTVSYSKEHAGEVEQKDVLKLADYVRYVVKAAGKRGAITLREAREIDSN